MNAELRRNLWLEMTPQRLIVMPLVLILLFALGWLADRHHLGPASAAEALVLFLLITVIWGARLAAQSLNDEFTQGTWDAQRGSGLSAWSLVSGKILGGAGFAWSTGGLSLLIYLLATTRTLGPGPALTVICAAIAAAVLAQAGALLLTLAWWRKGGRRPTNRTGRGFVWLLALLLVLHSIGRLHDLTLGHPLPVIWYGRPWPARGFVLVSLLLFAAWAVVGAVRLMRTELLLRDRPLAWAAFLLFTAAYLDGWVGSHGLPAYFDQIRISPALARASGAALLGVAATYLTLFYERKDWTALRRLIHSLRRPMTAARDMPLWLASLLLTLIAALATTLLALLQSPAADTVAIVAGVTDALCFVLRDLLLVLWLSSSSKTRRSDATAGVYLMVLYGLLPLLAWFAGLRPLLGLFNPLAAFAQPVWLIAGATQLAVMLDLTRRRRRALLRANA